METELRKFGLSEKEAKIYLCVLRLGTGAITRISELTKIAKTTCYDVLASLAGRGLVSSFVREKVKYFSAAKPEQMLRHLEMQKQAIKHILPKLHELKASVADKPKVELIPAGKESRQYMMKC